MNRSIHSLFVACRLCCSLVAGLLLISLAIPFGQTAFAQAIEVLEVKSTDRVFWRGKDGQNYLIINVFANQSAIGALDAVKRNTLLINTALKEGALQLERPESNTLNGLSVLFVSMKDMSEYGGSNSNWTQVGTGTLVKNGNVVSMSDIKLAGSLPSPVPTVSFPYKEASAAATATSIRFRMPDKLYVVEGQKQEFYYENLLVSRDIEDYIFTPTGSASSVGAQGRRGLTFEPIPAHVGEHDLFIKVSDWAGKVVAEGATKLVVLPNAMSWQPATGEPVRILVIGHSLPSMYYPAYVADHLAGPGNPPIEFMGGIKYWYGQLPGIKNNPDLANMYHQASPGYSIASVLNMYTDEPPANPNMPAKSPFIFKDASGKPVFNMKRYFDETLKGKAPHFILLNIGDNDTFGYDPEKPDPAQEKSFIDNANLFLNELRKIAPEAVIGAIMPNTYNFSNRSFLHNYGPNFSRFRQMQNRQRYIEMMSDIARARGDLSIIPSNFSVDSVDGMPFNSGTHFNLLGAQQFSTSVYAWIKGQFALKGGQSATVQPAPVASPPAQVVPAVVPAPVVPPAPAATAPAAPAPVPSPPAPSASAATPNQPPVAIKPAQAAPAGTPAPVVQGEAERPNWFVRFYRRMAKALSLN